MSYYALKNFWNAGAWKQILILRAHSNTADLHYLFGIIKS